MDQWWAPKHWKSETSYMIFVENGHRVYAMVGPEGERHLARTDYKTINPQETFSGEVQHSLTNFYVLKITYLKEFEKNPVSRNIESFAIYHSFSEDWIVVAWCRLRNEFRNFRIDRIKTMTSLSEKFVPHQLTLEEYWKSQQNNAADTNWQNENTNP